MKKTLITSLVAVVFGAVCYAQTQTPAPENKPQIKETQPQTPAKKEIKKDKIESVMGEIVKINEVKNQAGAVEKVELSVKIKAKGKKEAEEKVFAISPDLATGLKAGEKVKIKLVNGEVKKIKQIKNVGKAEKKMEKQEKKEMKEENKPSAPATLAQPKAGN